MFLDGLVAKSAHDGAHKGLELADGAALAVKVHLRILVEEAVVLTVIVPDGVGANVDDVLNEVILPDAARLGLGVVPESAVAAPPGADGIGVGILAVAHKHALLVEFIEPGVAQEDAGLDVRYVLGALFVHGGKVGARVLETLGVPGEDAALAVYAGVAGGKVETVDGEAFLLDGVDEVEDRVVTVLLEFGVVHARALVAQRALRQQGGTAGEQGVVIDDLFERSAAQ